MDKRESCSTEESTWMIVPMTGSSPSNSNMVSLLSSYTLDWLGADSLNGFDVSEQRISAISGIMEALTDANDVINGVYGTQASVMVDLVERVTRRAHRDSLFDKVIRVSAAMTRTTTKPGLKRTNLLFGKILRMMIERTKPITGLKRIQGELAEALGFTMKEKSEAKRACLLRERIKMEQRILVVLQDLNQGLDLQRLGIPFGDDHRGCKILLTSTSQEILSNHMHAHKVFEAALF